MSSVSGGQHGRPPHDRERDRDRGFWERMTYWPPSIRRALNKAIDEVLGSPNAQDDEGCDRD